MNTSFTEHPDLNNDLVNKKEENEFPFMKNVLTEEKKKKINRDAQTFLSFYLFFLHPECTRIFLFGKEFFTEIAIANTKPPSSIGVIVT